MIEGVTKRFEYGRTVDPDERRAATAIYIAGLQGLFDRFDPQTNGSDLLNLEVSPEGSDVPMPVTVERRLHSVVATRDQTHSWMMSREGLVERSDSALLGRNEPELEQIVSFDLPIHELMGALQQVAAEREALGMSGQPVDVEEAAALFSLLDRARLLE